MSLVKKKLHLYIGAFVLMSCYLCIVITHLFFLPKFQQTNNSAGNPVFAKNTQMVYYLVRNDRSMSNGKPGIKISPKVRSIASIMPASQNTSASTVFISQTGLSRLSVVSHYTWLFDRTIRT
jgi:hypothetical protein